METLRDKENHVIICNWFRVARLLYTSLWEFFWECELGPIGYFIEYNNAILKSMVYIGPKSIYVYYGLKLDLSLLS